jgi:hypothetical protein
MGKDFVRHETILETVDKADISTLELYLKDIIENWPVRPFRIEEAERLQTARQWLARLQSNPGEWETRTREWIKSLASGSESAYEMSDWTVKE